MTDFGVVRADRLDIFLVEDEAVRSRAKVEHALLRGRHTLENAQNQTAGPAAADSSTKPARFLAHPWPILNQYREIVDPLSEFRWESVQHFFHQLNDVPTLHVALPRVSVSPLLPLHGTMAGMPVLSGVGAYS